MNSEATQMTQEGQGDKASEIRSWETSEWFRKWLQLIRESGEPARA